MKLFAIVAIAGSVVSKVVTPLLPEILRQGVSSRQGGKESLWDGLSMTGLEWVSMA